MNNNDLKVRIVRGIGKGQSFEQICSDLGRTINSIPASLIFELVDEGWLIIQVKA